MSFWKTFGFHTVSAIDNILDSDDYTLEQLLDEEEILQETKAQNKKLIDFLTEQATLEKLVSYITEEVEDENDTKRKYKYPFLACEILASEVWSICDAFYQYPKLLDDLYGFLNKEPPLNPMLASYTCRVAAVLLTKKVAETLAFMKERKSIIPSFIKHLGNSSVMDLLLKVIACEDTPDGNGVLEWLCQTDLIPSLVHKFEPKLGHDVHENASQALVDIVAISVTSASSPLIAQLESEDMVKILFEYILADGLNSSLLHGLSVISELLKRHINEHHNTTTTVEQLPTLLKYVVSNMDKLHQFLKTPPQNSNNNNDVKLLLPAGQLEPLGFHRLKIIEFFTILSRTNYKAIDDLLMQSGVIASTLDLFFVYAWNNFLHTLVEQTIQGILEGDNVDMKRHLLVDAGLLRRIVDATKENDVECTKHKGVRRGYMGHLSTIAQAILQTASVDPAVEVILNDSPDWIEYVKGPLAQTKERETRTLASYISTDFTDEHDDQDDYGEDLQHNNNDFNIDEDDDDDEDQFVQAHLDEDDDEDIVEVTQTWQERQIVEIKEDSHQEPDSATTDESDSAPSHPDTTTTTQEDEPVNL